MVDMDLKVRSDRELKMGWIQEGSEGEGQS